MYTAHHPCWDAKNRDGLPSKLPFEYSQIAHIINGNSAPHNIPNIPQTEPPKVDKAVSKPDDTKPAASSEPVKTPEPATKPEPVSVPPKPIETKPASPPSYMADFEEVVSEKDIPPGIPDKLKDLMIANGVTEEDIRVAVSNEGYYPLRMPVANYPPDYIEDVLIAAWEQVYAKIAEYKKIPF